MPTPFNSSADMLRVYEEYRHGNYEEMMPLDRLSRNSALSLQSALSEIGTLMYLTSSSLPISNRMQAHILSEVSLSFTFAHTGQGMFSEDLLYSDMHEDFLRFRDYEDPEDYADPQDICNNYWREVGEIKSSRDFVEIAAHLRVIYERATKGRSTYNWQMVCDKVQVLNNLSTWEEVATYLSSTVEREPQRTIDRMPVATDRIKTVENPDAR